MVFNRSMGKVLPFAGALTIKSVPSELHSPKKRVAFNVKKGILTFLFVLVLAGCITAGKTQWAARVGHYTLEQAVLELGTPTKSALLLDGEIMVEWVTPNEENVKPNGPNQEWPGHYHGGMAGVSAPPSFPASHLRLTFAPDETLTDWKMYSR